MSTSSTSTVLIGCDFRSATETFSLSGLWAKYNKEQLKHHIYTSALERESNNEAYVRPEYHHICSGHGSSIRHLMSYVFWMQAPCHEKRHIRHLKWREAYVSESFALKLVESDHMVHPFIFCSASSDNTDYKCHTFSRCSPWSILQSNL